MFVTNCGKLHTSLITMFILSHFLDSVSISHCIIPFAIYAEEEG
jgi:hypothetical protein